MVESVQFNLPITGFSRVYGTDDTFSQRQMDTIADGGRWLIVNQDLLQRVPTDLELLDCRSLAQTFDKDLTANFRPKLHIYVQSGTSSTIKISN